MPIEIKITLETGESLRAMLESAGLIPGVLYAVERNSQDHSFGHGSTYVGPPSFGKTAHFPGVETRLVPEAPALTPAEQAEAAEEDAAGIGATEPRKRGRPRGSTAAAKAAAERAATAEPSAGEVHPPEWTVRRYGGDIDTLHLTPSSASARMVELIGAAGALQALDELMDANGALIEAMPEAVAGTVTDAAEKARAALTPPAEPAQPEAPPAPSWPLAEDRSPLVTVQPTKQGARDVVMAIATGPAPHGHMAAMRLLEQHGVSKLSEIPDGDERFAKIAAAGAAALGLPMASVGGLM